MASQNSTPNSQLNSSSNNANYNYSDESPPGRESDHDYGIHEDRPYRLTRAEYAEWRENRYQRPPRPFDLEATPPGRPNVNRSNAISANSSGARNKGDRGSLNSPAYSIGRPRDAGIN